MTHPAAGEVPLAMQIQEIEREIAMRANFYPGWVARGKMRHGEAEEHLRRMRAVLETLKGLIDDNR